MTVILAHGGSTGLLIESAVVAVPLAVAGLVVHRRRARERQRLEAEAEAKRQAKVGRRRQRARR